MEDIRDGKVDNKVIRAIYSLFGDKYGFMDKLDNLVKSVENIKEEYNKKIDYYN